MRLIDADALLKAFDNDIDTDVCQTFLDCYSEWGFSRDTVERAITDAPTIEAEPVRHGRWEYHDCVCTGDGLIAVYACSACQGCIDEDVFDQLHETRFCPNCGAKMDGDSK